MTSTEKPQALVYGFDEGFERNGVLDVLRENGYEPVLFLNTYMLDKRLADCNPGSTILVLGTTDISGPFSLMEVVETAAHVTFGLGDIQPYKTNAEMMVETLKICSPLPAAGLAYGRKIPTVFSTFQDICGLTLDKVVQTNPHVGDATYPYNEIGLPSSFQKIISAVEEAKGKIAAPTVTRSAARDQAPPLCPPMSVAP